MKQKYEHIQLLRALACIGVFITHLAPRLGATGKAAWLANQGAAGVYLFFVLSGYLACCDRKLPTAGKKELLTYYKKRLVRILPLYYGVILYNILLHGLILKDIPADPQGIFNYLAGRTAGLRVNKVGGIVVQSKVAEVFFFENFF